MRPKQDLTDDEPERDLRPGAITRLVQQQRNAERVSVFIDGTFAFGLALDLAVRAGLRKGQPLTVEAQQALLDDEERLRAKAAALDYIAYQARTEEEVRRKLARKGFPDHVADEAVARMRELGYLDDEAYARAYARGRLAGRGHGPQRIRSDLRKRGVASKTIDTVLDEVVEQDDLREAALQHGRKRWVRLQREADPRKRRKKLSDFLVRRGYGFDLIREVVETLEAEDGGAEDG
ncbi:MAG: RecX family transcriptional regulator [Bacteroidota bacterium]